MFKSVFLRRIVSLIVITVVLFALLTSILYFIISRNIYSDMKAKELEPKAESIASFVQMYRDGSLSLASFAQLISAGPSAWDAWVFVLDANGDMVVHTNIPDSVDPNQNFVAEISKRTKAVLSGNKIKFAGNLSNSKFGMIIVGIPVIDNNSVVGAVFLAKPLVELNAGVYSLSGALFISTCICLALMVLPILYAVSRLIKPLKQTRDVALAMASGNFSVRADESSKGEIGDLAISFNLLGDRLERTISDLVLEKNRLMRILNGLAEGIIAVDINCNVTHANPALWRLINQHKLGHFSIDVNKDSERALMIRPKDPKFIRHQLITDESVWDEFRNVIHTNTPVRRDLIFNESVIRVIITPIEDESGKTVGAVGLFQDITEAEILERTRKDYIANVSHELRTPLTAMRGLIEPLSDGLVKSQKDKKRYYDIILRETLRLSRLIEDMLELSRLQSGKTVIEEKPFLVQEIIFDVIDKFQKAAGDKDIELNIGDNIRSLPLVVASPDRIEQILVILIDNAMKFTSAGGKISILSTVNSSYNNSKVYISVKDTGVGIDPEIQPKVFERFFKADKARYGTAGTGLGLSIAKEILNSMGETISVESEPGKGSTFTFSISVA